MFQTLLCTGILWEALNMQMAGPHPQRFWLGRSGVAAAAKSLQSWLTLWPHRRQPTRLCRPWDSPGKNTGVGCHFLLQCIKVKVKMLSCVRLFGTPWTAAYQAPPSMGFSRQEYWSGLPLPSLRSRVGPDNFHFSQGPRWYCWWKDHIL